MIFIEIIGDFFKANTQCIYLGAIYKKMIAYIMHFVNQFLVFYIFLFQVAFTTIARAPP